MMNEKSPGSVWNVAIVAIALFIGAMALNGVMSADNKNTITASMN
jgi:hypothetical protein